MRNTTHSTFNKTFITLLVCFKVCFGWALPNRLVFSFVVSINPQFGIIIWWLENQGYNDSYHIASSHSDTYISLLNSPVLRMSELYETPCVRFVCKCKIKVLATCATGLISNVSFYTRKIRYCAVLFLTSTNRHMANVEYQTHLRRLHIDEYSTPINRRSMALFKTS